MSNINTTSSFDFPGSNKGMHYETRCGNLMKVIWHDGQGACLFTKRLERGRFLWPSPVRHRLETPTGDLAADIGGVMLFSCGW
jgi:hypothetical protein